MKLGRALRSTQGVGVWMMNAALALSLLLNVCLGASLRHAANHGAGPAVGDLVPVITGKSKDGQVRLDFRTRQQPVILYYYSPTCRWCDRNWSNVQALASQTAGRFRFVAVSSSEDAGSLDALHRQMLPGIFAVPAAERAAYGFSSTPRTMVVSDDGRVLGTWAGAYQDELKAKLQEFFGVTLPGLDRIAQ